MITCKRIAVCWLWLIVLTLISVGFGLYFQTKAMSHAIFIFIVMVIVTLKGQQIIDVFMELKYAPKKWRYLLLSYIVIVPTIIAGIYI
jgi:cytochrome c oxidase subunit 4